MLPMTMALHRSSAQRSARGEKEDRLLQKSLSFYNDIMLGQKNSLYNWWDEFHKWRADDDLRIHFVDLSVHKTVKVIK